MQDAKIWHKDYDSYLYYPIEEMAKDMSLSKKRIKKCLKELEDVGLIKTNCTVGAFTNLIRVNNCFEQSKN